jgi:hypothetical protein
MNVTNLGIILARKLSLVDGLEGQSLGRFLVIKFVRTLKISDIKVVLQFLYSLIKIQSEKFG